MNQKGIKLITLALTGAILFTGVQISGSAAGTGSVLPVAGLALTLEEGTPYKNIKKVSNAQAVKTISNINQRAASAETILDNVIVPSITKSPFTANSVSANNLSSDNVMAYIEEVQTAKASVIPEVDQPLPGTEEVTESVEEVVELDEVEEEEKYFSTLVIAKVNDYVNVRSIPSEEGEILGKLYDKSVGEFVSEQDGWYEITSGSVTGWVKAEYVVTGDDAIELAKEVGNRIATVTTTTLFVRSEPSIEATNIGMVPIEEQLSVLEELDGWVKVSIEEGEGYVSAEYVTLHTEFVKAESKAEEEARKKAEEEAARAARAAAEAKIKKTSTTTKQTSTTVVASGGGSSTGNAVANYALQFVGNPYVYGGTSLTNGADCSGFTQSVYANFGVALPRTSGSQRSAGYDVGSLANAQPGDLICYSGHVALYIGNGQIVHASTAKTGIIVSNASYRKILAVRRIF